MFVVVSQCLLWLKHTGFFRSFHRRFHKICVGLAFSFGNFKQFVSGISQNLMKE
jgi:hypothetical protein